MRVQCKFAALAQRRFSRYLGQGLSKTVGVFPIKIGDTGPDGLAAVARSAVVLAFPSGVRLDRGCARQVFGAQVALDEKLCPVCGRIAVPKERLAHIGPLVLRETDPICTSCMLL